MTEKENLRDYRIMGFPVLVFLGGLALFGLALTGVLQYFAS